MVQIIEKQIQFNIKPLARQNKDIKFLVVHYTANNGGNSLMHYKYFNSGNRKSSADVFIDDLNIRKINNWNKYYTYAVGDGDGKYGITNKNSISIEMCLTKEGKISEQTLKNTIEYIVYLLQNEFKHLSINEVVRHYDASRKLCPKMFVDLSIKGYNKIYKDFRKAIEDQLNFVENRCEDVEGYNYKEILKQSSKYYNTWYKIIDRYKNEFNLAGLIENIYKEGLKDGRKK